MAKRKPLGGQLGLGFGMSKPTASARKPKTAAKKNSTRPARGSALVQVSGYCAAPYTRRYPTRPAQAKAPKTSTPAKASKPKKRTLTGPIWERSWWQQLVAERDDYSLRELGEKYGVTPANIREGFKRQNVSRYTPKAAKIEAEVERVAKSYPVGTLYLHKSGQQFRVTGYKRPTGRGRMVRVNFRGGKPGNEKNWKRGSRTLTELFGSKKIAE